MSGSGVGRDTTVAYVIGTYPLLTTTFIDREIAAVRRLGIRVLPISLRRPHGALSASQEEAALGVTYVTPVSVLDLIRAHARFLATRPGRYLSVIRRLVTAPHPTSRSRFRTVGHFALAVHVAAMVARSGPIDRVHAHFVDRAALVALVVGRLLDIPYSATAHANDIYVDPVLLPEKVLGASFVATCTGANARHLEDLIPGSGQVRILHHGLDVASYGVSERVESDRPVLLAVGQLKEKKGLIHLVEACRLLREAGHAFRCEVVGEGPQRSALQEAIAQAGLEDVVLLRGALSHDDVRAAYGVADLFVLPCVVAPDGDRDGIPNVILEAMASGLPVVSTDHSGIPEAVDHGETGILVPPGDAVALAEALGTLLADPGLRRRYGEAGRTRVADRFDLERNVQRLVQELVS